MSRGVSDKITYKPYNQGGQWLLPPSLDELVPQNHFARIVSKTVDELEIEEAFARNTKGGGASRYNPVMLLKVMIYCYMTGPYSSIQNCGTGSALVEFALQNFQADFLWALEKNARAISFYSRHGFFPTGARKHEESTTEYIIELRRK